MTYKVGGKGEVVIRKELRDQLGIEPGWIALQRLVNNRIEIRQSMTNRWQVVLLSM